VKVRNPAGRFADAWVKTDTSDEILTGAAGGEPVLLLLSLHQREKALSLWYAASDMTFLIDWMQILDHCCG
jgi:hypothetical protein